ncbi:btk-binding protein-related [Anaeramoeba flamelloides]|uniref:Btk-binding protein-related n=1 Tax=Anaeramoeba flamelloides TaxID=1746091 RepID=A0AAV8A4R5_9EUKA|nr:btk-binding protein-related [Anaeramoeba flamelloides]
MEDLLNPIYCQSKYYKQFSDEKQSLEPNWYSLTKVKHRQRIKKIACDSSDKSNLLVWIGTNQLMSYRFENNKVEIDTFFLEDQTIKDIQGGYQTYQILTHSGKVYSLGISNSYCQIPLKVTPKKWEPVLVTFFEENNLFVEEISMCCITHFYLCKGGKLYGSGYNSDGRFGNGTAKDSNLPIFLCDNVERVFPGVYSLVVFYTTTDNRLWGSGPNSNSKLGTGNNKSTNKAIQISGWEASNILELCSCQSHSVLVTRDFKTYSTGHKEQNGHGVLKEIFTEIRALKSKPVIKVLGGKSLTLALTSQNELYGWGFQSENLPTDQYQNFENWKTPKLIKIPKFYQASQFNIACGGMSIFLYTNIQNNVSFDFNTLLEKNLYCDTKIGASGYERECHKLIVELRTHLKMEAIQKIFIEHSLNKEDANIFLKWVYSDQAQQFERLKEIFSLLKIPFPPKNNFEQDIFNLFQDEDSTDFDILVKDDVDYDEDNDDDEEEDEDEEYEKIPVHKLILCARSGLFRDMFENVNQEQSSNTVRDYSGKSIESLEILIKYFYTDKIELTADHDPELIYEELEDAQEYYQLSQNSNINLELNKIKRLFTKN